FLDHAKCMRCEPAAVARGEKRRLAELAAIRRVGEYERKGGADAAGAGPERRRIALVELRMAVEAQMIEIFADGGAAFGVIVHKHCERCAARRGFEAERARTGEEVEHARAFKREAAEIGMSQNVEQCLALALAGGAHAVAFRRGDAAALMGAADDPHGVP